MEFGKKLQQLRKENHMSQEKLAEHLNVSRQAISKWEQGIVVPDTENIIRISRFFQVPIEFLLLDKYDTVEDFSNSDLYNTHQDSKHDPHAKDNAAENPKQTSKRILIAGLIVEVAAVFGCYVMQWYELTLFNSAYTNALLYLFKMPVVLLFLSGILCILRGYSKKPLKDTWQEVWKSATEDSLRNTLDDAENDTTAESENVLSEKEYSEK